jgi:hypothetical protein
MSCCGQKRLALTATPRRTPAMEAPAPRPARPAKPALRYLREGSLALRGPHTGRVYSFDAAGQATAVDPQDLEALLRTRLFERIVEIVEG